MIIQSNANQTITRFKNRLGLHGEVSVLGHYIIDRRSATQLDKANFSIPMSDLEKKTKRGTSLDEGWNSICAWGPTAMLPIFQLLGTDYVSKQITSHLIAENFDTFTKIAFVYPHAVASLKVGKGVKSEGELIISGTKGYIYVPAPWWKTDYFEIRYENPSENKRYFYQLDGEGIRYEIVSFARAIGSLAKDKSHIVMQVTSKIVNLIECFNNRDIITI